MAQPRMLSGLSKDVPFFSRLKGPAESQFQNQRWLSHLIIFRSELTIAQRFNAGHYAFLFVESHRDDRDFLSFFAGLDLHFISKPSVKTLGYCQACAAAAKENFLFMRWLTASKQAGGSAWQICAGTQRCGFLGRAIQMLPSPLQSARPVGASCWPELHRSAAPNPLESPDNVPLDR
jgi:hypothetical protein